MSFATFQLDQTILTGVRRLGFQTPTPIQRQAIPAVLAGRDVMGLAQTGTGKTAAFVLPMLQRLLSGQRGHVRALILAPTRELAEQTHRSIIGLGCGTRIRSATVYGGVSIQPQIQTLRRGVDIIAACPGRLLDHLQRGTISLKHLDFLVLDEADQMFDMGFLPDIRKIIKYVPAARQTLLFSATMPREIKTLAAEMLNNAVTVQIGLQAPAETVGHAFYAVDHDHKKNLLFSILAGTDLSSVLVFTRTKRRASDLALQLEQNGFGATALHGNLSQPQRLHAMKGFSCGRYRILVATDIAARGIDVSGISHVINYDMPDTADAYTHRIGRTGRAEKTGEALSFITRSDVALVRALERALGPKITYRGAKGGPAQPTGAPVRTGRPVSPAPDRRTPRGAHGKTARTHSYRGMRPGVRE